MGQVDNPRVYGLYSICASGLFMLSTRWYRWPSSAIPAGKRWPVVPSFRWLNDGAAHQRHARLIGVGLFTLLFAFATTAGASTLRQEAQPKALGSLSVAGGVTVNGSPAQPTQTIFAGDTLLTTNTGTATFTVSGQGSFKIAPLSQVSFSDGTRYIMELKQGTVVMDTFSAHSNLAMRIGDYIVMADPTASQAAIIIKAESNGAGVISCSPGAGHLPRQEQTAGGDGQHRVPRAGGESRGWSTGHPARERSATARSQRRLAERGFGE